MKAPITEKVKELYDYIRAYHRENRFPPTVREIQKHFGIKSTASVSYYLKQLEADGLIRHSKQKKRSIEIVGETGTITGAKSVNGEAFTDVDTYNFNGPVETFDIDVNVAGTSIQLTTTGSFTSAWLILEG